MAPNKVFSKNFKIISAFCLVFLLFCSLLAKKMVSRNVEIATTTKVNSGGTARFYPNATFDPVIDDSIPCPFDGFFLGDGVCQDMTNFRYCDFDGGDCCLPNIIVDCAICACHKVPRHHLPNGWVKTSESQQQLATLLPESCLYIIGDGFCDGDCDTPQGSFDGGDCCLSNTIVDCHLTPHETSKSHTYGFASLNDGCNWPCLNQIGDGVCDDECNTPQCSFDAGDCCDKSASTVRCNLCECKVKLPACPGAMFINNGFCDEVNMKPVCFFDGGDCDK